MLKPFLARCLPLAVAALLALPLWADDDPADPKPKSTPQAPADPDDPEDDPEGEDADEGADRYRVPETDLDELRKFIVSMLSFQPESREQALEHQEKAVPAVRTAAKRILKLEKDRTADVAKMAQAVLLQLDIQEMRQGNDVDPEAVVERTLKFVEMIGDKAGGFEVQLVMLLGETLEATGEDALAAKTYQSAAKVLGGSEDERVAQIADLLAGMARRLDLPGKVLKIEGETLEGEEFDLKSLRGKVVLVDFWATWCGPCLAEIPNMLANYKRFQDQGFEIVGISLDDDREALEGFMERRELPWTILHDSESSGGHPAATYYGVRGIPSMFLVDAEGKVISTNARGSALTRILEEKFPNTPELQDDKEEDKDDEKEGEKEGEKDGEKDGEKGERTPSRR